MALQDEVMEKMKEAMRAKDTETLASLRAIKSAILLAQTESGAKKELSETEEMRLLQRLVKQRKESASIFREQGREDLAAPEMAQAKTIEAFLPAQMSEEAIEAEVEKIISQTGAEGMKDMGKVMGIASKQRAGKADGKTISAIVKKKLG